MSRGAKVAWALFIAGSMSLAYGIVAKSTLFGAIGLGLVVALVG